MVLDGQQELVALLSRVAGRDREAFRSLYSRTSAKLYASVMRISGNQAAAEDAVQEAYVKIWTRAGEFDSDRGSAIAWMTTIARHAAIDAVRRGAERVSASSTEIDPETIDSLADPFKESLGPSATPRLATCLDNLEADRRSMVVLAYCMGWSREELAHRFDRPVATVKTILRRSLIALKECLGGSD